MTKCRKNDDVPHSSTQDANLSPPPALTNRPLSPEMKARGVERERGRQREREADGAEAWEEGEEGEEGEGGEDFAALLADLVQSLWCSNWIPIQAFA